jgi:hypothetical protein
VRLTALLCCIFCFPHSRPNHNHVLRAGGWNDPILHPVNYVVTRAIRLLQPLIIERNRRLEPNYITIQDQRNWVHLGYYRNQIVHLFKDECIMAVALYSFGTSTHPRTHPPLLTRVYFLIN